jgi:hypothetical protein
MEYIKSVVSKFDNILPIGWITFTSFSLAVANEILQCISVIAGLIYLLRKWYLEEKKHSRRK